MGKEIRIIRKDGSKISPGYTFIDNSILDLTKIDNQNDSKVSSSSDDKKYKEYAFKLRKNLKKDTKARGRSRLVGGHSTKSHSPVYE